MRKSSTSDPSGSSAWARTPAVRRHEVGRRHLRNIAPRLGGEGALGQRPAKLTCPHAPVRTRQRAEAARPERLGEVAERDVAPPVALARERKDGVGADVDAAADAVREVHAEERVAGVGHGVQKTAHEA